MMKPKYLHIETIGCQMNVYDTGRIIDGLSAIGFEVTDSPARADVILLNTCAIREKAEQKAFSYLGRLTELKRKNPSLIIGIGGCVAQQEGERIIRRVPHVDLVFGTHAVNRLPDMIQRIQRQRCRVVDVEMSTTIDECPPALKTPDDDGGPTRFVTIMRGCDNFCAYCVVPYVRGREVSRAPDAVVSEIEALVASGTREVTLLGQNVNSYGKKEGLCSFPELLRKVSAVDGLCRIRFTTSHPKDISDELILAFKHIDKLCRHIHLPVQSGSDEVLKRMNRRYTRERYLERVDALRKACPDIAVTSDFIVGFPGETEDDFQKTLDLIQNVRFDSVFAFKYSDRPNAPAASYPDKVPEEEKARRLSRLFELQNRITGEKNEALVGSRQTVLVEGKSRKQGRHDPEDSGKQLQWTGRTSCNRIVNFSFDRKPESGGENRIGTRVEVRIQRALAHSLWGVPDGKDIRATCMKGADNDAA